MPADVLREQERIARADAIAFVFPVWWWSFPAMLKGWVERVWCSGWAYDFAIERSVGRLKLNRAVMICPGGTATGTYRRYGYQEAMHRNMDVGVMGYCGISDVEMHIFPGVDDDASAREAYLRVAYDIGEGFEPSDSVITLTSRSHG
jgi:NAD(P)H dehydrogenase (quinone)